MGGMYPRYAHIAVLATAFAVLTLGAPAPALAAGPLDAVIPAVPSAGETAAGVTGEAQQAASAVREAADANAPAVAVERAGGNGSLPVPAAAADASAGRRDNGPTKTVAGPAAATRSNHVTRAAAERRSHAQRSSPPHRHHAVPSARSHPGRAGVSRPPADHRPAPRTSAQRDHERGPGLAGAAGAPPVPIVSLLGALLLAALAASRPSILRTLDLPVPVLRRPALVSPVEPPG
jgi:hypothetical protein